jgi:FAD/FMN-containing dehydrogenase
VPRVHLPEILEKICEICARYELKLANVFHAGDGNLHPNICFDRRDADELARVTRAGEEILEACVAVGGVISGEHGIGIEKRDYMHLVFGENDLEPMYRLRECFNPEGLCNPGKIIPTTRFCVESNPKMRGYDAVPIE